MKNTTVLIGIVILLVVAGYFVFANSGKGSVNLNGNSANEFQEVQKVVLSFKNSNYYPNEVKVKANRPVSISLDDSVKLCFRTFTIKDLGVNKYLKTPLDSVEFIPTKPGTYTFACGMGMGFGKLIVE